MIFNIVFGIPLILTKPLMYFKLSSLLLLSHFILNLQSYYVFLALLEYFFLPRTHIRYYKTKRKLEENKSLISHREQFPSLFFQNYEGFIYIPITIRDSISKRKIIQQFFEYMLKRIFSHWLIMNNERINLSFFLPFNFFIQISLFSLIFITFEVILLEVFCRDLNLKLGIGVIFAGSSIVFYIWFFFFLEKLIRTMPSNVLAFVGKYIHRNLTNNLHLFYVSPYAQKREINVYSLFYGESVFSEEENKSINLIIQIILIFVLSLGITVLISYLSGDLSPLKKGVVN